MFSQLVDSTAVILVTYIAAASFTFERQRAGVQLLALLHRATYSVGGSCTGHWPIYLAVRYLRVYLGLGENEETAASERRGWRRFVQDWR